MAGGGAGVADLCGSGLLNQKHSPADLKRALAGEAKSLGFDCIGVTAPDATGKAGEYFRAFLDAGGHGDMDWLAANPERRMDPRVLWPGVRSIVMLGVNYGPDENPLDVLKMRTRGAISVYAKGDDYHDVIKKRLKMLARWLAAKSGDDVKVFVDTAAVMEKPLAQAAGLGWQGKHTNLVSRELGSWLFLGAIYSDVRAAVRRSRRRSLRLLQRLPGDSARPRPSPRPTSWMPAAAFPISRSKTRARSRTSFAKASATASMAATIASRYARGTNLRRKAAKRNYPRARSCGRRQLSDLARLDDAAFRALFTKSPVKRIGRDRFIRNVLIAIGNADDPSLALEAERLLDDASPLVRGAAVWALSQLVEREKFEALAAKEMGREIDEESVRAEWRQAIRCLIVHPRRAGHRRLEG